MDYTFNISEKRQSIKWKMMFILFAIFFLIGLILGIVNLNGVEQSMQENMSGKMESIIESFKYTVDSKVNDLKIAQNFILNDQETIRLFENREREKLSEKYLGLFQNTLKPRFKVNIFQFHIPPATSFLRIHKPGKFGDDLSRFRNTVVHANKEKIVQAGIEVGKYGASIRVVYPVENNNIHIGSVELGADYIDLMENVARSLKVNFAIGIDENVLKNAGFKLKTETIKKGNIVYYYFSNKKIQHILNTNEIEKEVRLVELEDKIYANSSFILSDYSQASIGTIVITQDITELMGNAKTAVYKKIALLFLFIFIVAVIIYYILTKSIFSPLLLAVNNLELISRGDLTATLDHNSNDELGRLTQTINDMSSSLKTMVSGIREKAETLSGSAEEFTAISQGMLSNSENLAEKSASVSSAAEEMNVNMSSISAAAEQSSSNIANVVTTTEEMASTVSEISQNTAQAQQIASRAVEAALSASEKINQLGNSAEDISRVIEVINDIADQTKLLALNATIEAARAGEAGKGFAVVANEVKELARQTNEATEGITQKINNMQESAGISVKEINNISSVISEINEITAGIASAVEEQAVTTKDISGNIGHAAQGVSDVTISVSQAGEASKLIAEDIATLNEESNEARQASQQVESGVSNMAQLSKDLKQLVENFKL